MNIYKLTIAYDGTDYFGWQWQPDRVSVNQILLDSFKKLFKQDTLYLVGASRTDAGVHAQGQVVRIKTHITTIDSQKMKKIWNDVLPPSIMITSIEQVDDQFHPQHNIVKKVYEYTFFLERPYPKYQRFGCFFYKKIDGIKLSKALSLFVGTHDFRMFCKEESDKNTIRTVDTISLVHCKETGGYKIIVEGSSFLRHMIRRIVGAALYVASNEYVTEKVIIDALLQKKGAKILPKAVAKGLCLKSIEYK